MLILPGTEDFLETLDILPPNWMHIREATNGSMAIVKRLDGLMEAVPWHEAQDYMWGGEYDELEKINQDGIFNC